MKPLNKSGPNTLVILSLNCALLNLRWLGLTLYRPTPWTNLRLEYLIRELAKSRAHLVLLQECFHYRQQARICHELSEYYPHSSLQKGRGIPTRLGTDLLVLSRYSLDTPIQRRFNKATIEERLFTRLGFLSVDVHIPGSGPFQLLNFHLSAGGLYGHPEDPAMESLRSKQIKQMLDHCNMNSPVILAGDLNAGPEASPENYNSVINSGFIDTYINANSSEVSWHPDNPLVRSGDESHLPEQRIDHIFINNPAAEKLNPVGASITMTDIFTNPIGEPLCISDHYGVEVEFELL